MALPGKTKAHKSRLSDDDSGVELQKVIEDGGKSAAPSRVDEAV